MFRNFFSENFSISFYKLSIYPWAKQQLDKHRVGCISIIHCNCLRYYFTMFWFHFSDWGISVKILPSNLYSLQYDPVGYDFIIDWHSFLSDHLSFLPNHLHNVNNFFAEYRYICLHIFEGNMVWYRKNWKYLNVFVVVDVCT